MKTLRSQYVRPSNIADISYLGINFYFIVDLFTGIMPDEQATSLSIAQAFLMAYAFINWLRVFKTTVIFIRLIKQTVTDMLPFLFLYFVILIMFSLAVLFLNLRRRSEQSIYDDEIFSSSYMNSWFSQYLLTLGEFNLDNYTSTAD